MTAVADRGPIRGFIDRDHVQCSCGHVEEIDPAGTYQVIPTGRYRYRTNPATSEVWREDEHEYICGACWAALPDGDEENP